VAVIPLLPMCDRSPEQHPFLGELMTVTKLLIEREQEKLSMSSGSQLACIEQIINPVEKNKMAEIIVKDCISSAGVCGAQKLVSDRMSRQIVHRCALKKGGLRQNSVVEFFADECDKEIYFSKVGATSEDQSSGIGESCRAHDEALYS